ncbi:MAG: type IV pilus modification protein PilV [Pseudohongiella sp.]|uniref:type IV pilus modification protein PilV n=1 Tax=Pseudohongiella sp. TaxID=1979412 RepID=UPI00349FE41D
MTGILFEGEVDEEVNEMAGTTGELNKSRGIALIEVLLSSFIMTTGMLAVLSLQTMALGRTQVTSHLLQAEWLLNDMLERMQANPRGFDRSLQTTPRGRITPRCETLSGCSPAALAAHDLARWHHQVETRLPGGNAEIVPTTVQGYPDSARIYQVSVLWQTAQGPLALPGSSAIVVL